MKVLNIGSLNLDYVYSVDHIILPGETEATGSRQVFLGGKGLNQSVALARAGVTVYHGGMVGQNGQLFLDACKEYGIHTELISRVDAPDGHTVIQIDRNAQNSILLFGGTNQMLTKPLIDEILSHFTAEDLLLLQNEVNLLPYIVEQAYARGMQIALNPSPFHETLYDVDLQKISLFLLNEVEGNQLTGLTEPDEILDRLQALYPHARVVLTLGKDGAIYAEGAQRIYQPIFEVQAVDTTAAGDTFTGYLIAGWIEGLPMKETLKRSAMASAIAVTRHGAVPSIPSREEVLSALGVE